MPDITPDKRSTRSNGKPPTALMQSYSVMGHKKRRELKLIGYGFLVFSLVTPVIGSIVMRVTVGAGLPGVAYLFCSVGLIIGLSLSWPEMGIYLLGRLPGAVSKLLPSKLAGLLGRPDRRNGS